VHVMNGNQIQLLQKLHFNTRRLRDNYRIVVGYFVGPTSSCFGRQPQNLLRVFSAGLPSQTLTESRSGECHHLQHQKFELYLANSC
jgi:hypothetical protein